MTTRSQGLLALALLSLIWGGYFLLIDIADDSLPPLSIAAARMLIGALVVYPFLRKQGLRLPPLGMAWLPLVVIGLFEALVPTVLVAFGEERVGSAVAAILFSTMPISTVLLAHFWLSKPITRNQALGIGLGFVGAVIVLSPSLAAGAKADLLGIAAILLAATCKAFAALYAHRTLKEQEPIQVATGMMISAGAIGLPMAVLIDRPTQLAPTAVSLRAVLGLGVFTAGIGFLIFFWLIKHRGPAFASLVRFNEPPVAILLAALFLGASLHWTTFVGMLVILLCLAIMNGSLNGFLGRVLRAKDPS